MNSSRSIEIHALLRRLQLGDGSAREEILRIASDSLVRLTRKMLRDFPGVGRWEDTDDVFQNACLRLHRALDSVTFETNADFFRFASAMIRRELIDLSRHYQGPQGADKNSARQFAQPDSFTSDRLNPATDTHDPQKVLAWTEFHQSVETLPEEDRQVFDLLWYQELSQGDAAVVLGVSERTVQRRWQQARIRLQSLLSRNGDRDQGVASSI